MKHVCRNMFAKPANMFPLSMFHEFHSFLVGEDKSLARCFMRETRQTCLMRETRLLEMRSRKMHGNSPPSSPNTGAPRLSHFQPPFIRMGLTRTGRPRDALSGKSLILIVRKAGDTTKRRRSACLYKEETLSLSHRDEIGQLRPDATSAWVLKLLVSVWRRSMVKGRWHGIWTCGFEVMIWRAWEKVPSQATKGCFKCGHQWFQ